MRSQNEVYPVPPLQLGGFVGGADAAGKGYLLDAARLPAAVELPEVCADAVHGVIADVAGVEDDEVGLLVGLNLGVAGVQNHAPHAVRVVYVHLAAEGTYASGPGGLGDAGVRVRSHRLRFPGELYGGFTHTLPPARRCGPSRGPLPGESAAR